MSKQGHRADIADSRCDVTVLARPLGVLATGILKDLDRLICEPSVGCVGRKHMPLVLLACVSISH